MADVGPIDQRTHRVLAGRSRVRVLEHLRAHGRPLTAAEVAEHVGLHANTVRLHLDQLADAGLVTRAREPRRGPGRPRLLFSAAPRPVDGEPATGSDDDGYRMLAGVLAGHLEKTSRNPADDAVDAGRDWARTLAAGTAAPPRTAAEAVERLVTALDELGFAPVPPDRAGGPIELHRCPFHQVAEQHSEVVCGIHLGLMQGLLDDLTAPLHATRLEPFVAPGVCRAHLTPAPPTEGF